MLAISDINSAMSAYQSIQHNNSNEVDFSIRVFKSIRSYLTTFNSLIESTRRVDNLIKARQLLFEYQSNLIDGKYTDLLKTILKSVNDSIDAGLANKPQGPYHIIESVTHLTLLINTFEKMLSTN